MVRRIICLSHQTSVDCFFGMQAGVIQYTSNLEGVNAQFPDRLFTPLTETKFNVGAGTLFKGDRYMIGLSAPHILASSTTVSHGAQSAQVEIYSQNYYLHVSYVFFVSEQIEFKPSTLLRMTKGSNLLLDFNANVTFNRLYTAGIFTRNLNTCGVLLQAVFKNARLGYVFELPRKSSALNFNTHEISLELSLDVLAGHSKTMTGFLKMRLRCEGFYLPRIAQIFRDE